MNQLSDEARLSCVTKQINRAHAQQKSCFADMWLLPVKVTTSGLVHWHTLKLDQIMGMQTRIVCRQLHNSLSYAGSHH